MLKGGVIYADSLPRIGTDSTVIEVPGDNEIGEQVYAFIRPENIVLSKTYTESSIRNSLQGKVTISGFWGSCPVKVDCGITLSA